MFKQITAFVVSCITIFGTASSSAEDRDLIIVAGQSNAVGFDAKPSLLPADERDKDVIFWFKIGDPPPDAADSSSDGKWTTLGPQPLGNPLPKNLTERQYGNFAQAEGGFGPEIGFCRTLLQKEPNRKLAVVKAAFSGTSIPQDWDPVGNEPNSACYKALVDQITKAAESAKANGVNLQPKYMIWVQGESDSTEERSKNYADNLTEMLTALRNDISAPDLKIALAVNTKFGNGKKPFMPKIVQSQKDVAAKDERIIYIDTSKATIANAAHYDTQGTLDVGKWIAEGLLSLD